MPTRGRPRLYKTHAEKMAAYRQRKRQRLTRLPEFPPLPTGPFQVVYADPPWWPFSLEPSGMPKRFQRLLLERLCGLSFKRRLRRTAMLFLWVPAPLLVEGLSVVTAWGFHYRGACVWDCTESHVPHVGQAPYLLLLVCTRGSDLPDGWDDLLSVQRTAAIGANPKPESFRQLIEIHTPEGPRLELFASRTVPGWDVWPT